MQNTRNRSISTPAAGHVLQSVYTVKNVGGVQPKTGKLQPCTVDSTALWERKYYHYEETAYTTVGDITDSERLCLSVRLEIPAAGRDTARNRKAAPGGVQSA